MSVPLAKVMLLWNALLDSDHPDEILVFSLCDWVGEERSLLPHMRQFNSCFYAIILSSFHPPPKKTKLNKTNLPEVPHNLVNLDPTDHMQRQPRTLLLFLMFSGRNSDSALFCLVFKA